MNSITKIYNNKSKLLVLCKTYKYFLPIFSYIANTFAKHNFLSKKIAADEKQKIEQWLQAVNDINDTSATSITLASKILVENSQDIPMITVTENDSILDHYNLDSARIKSDKSYLREKLAEFKKTYDPIVWKNPSNPSQHNLVYYGESSLLKQIRYYYSGENFQLRNSLNIQYTVRILLYTTIK